jgi:hypothetical protein
MSFIKGYNTYRTPRTTSCTSPRSSLNFFTSSLPESLHFFAMRNAVLPTEADIDKLGREAPITFISENRSRKSSRRTP